jgi:D-alanyl-D-alanine carboxypeptidase
MVVATPVVGAGSAMAASAVASKVDASLARALRALVGRPAGPPGVAAVVQRDRTRRFFTAGVADRRSRRRLRIDDHMRIASTTKAFEGAVVLALVQAGRLSLDDTIAQRLSDLPPAWGAITMRELLQHRSGLPNYTESRGLTDLLSHRPRAYVTPRELVGFVAATPLQFAPGSRYAYSNTDNLVAGLIVESVTRSPFEAQLGAEVLGPLRLRRTSLPSTFLLPTPYVHGYEPLTARRYEDVSEALSMASVWAAGGMVSSPADLNTFVRAYAGPRLVGAATRTQQLSFVPGSSDPPGPGTTGAGLAIFRYRTRCGTVYGHTGNFPGYTQFMAATGDGRRSLVVSANEQLSPAASAHPAVFRYLRSAFEAAVCSALAREP